jgi:hypothetical protein
MESDIDCCQLAKPGSQTCVWVEFLGFLFVNEHTVVSMRTGMNFAHCSDNSLVDNASDPPDYRHSFACCAGQGSCAAMPNTAPPLAQCL